MAAQMQNPVDDKPGYLLAHAHPVLPGLGPGSLDGDVDFSLGTAIISERKTDHIGGEVVPEPPLVQSPDRSIGQENDREVRGCHSFELKGRPGARSDEIPSDVPQRNGKNDLDIRHEGITRRELPRPRVESTR